MQTNFYLIWNSNSGCQIEFTVRYLQSSHASTLTHTETNPTIEFAIQAIRSLHLSHRNWAKVVYIAVQSLRREAK